MSLLANLKGQTIQYEKLWPSYFTILQMLHAYHNEVELWESISGDLNWQVKGQAYYSLSSMTAGGENIMDFVLTP